MSYQPTAESLIAPSTNPEPKSYDEIQKAFLDTVEGDLFSDIVIRACVLDLAMKSKILTRQQVSKLAGMRSQIEKSWKKLLPVAQGACEVASADLDEADSNAFDEANAQSVDKHLAAMSKRKLIRSEHLGPLSYTLL